MTEQELALLQERFNDYRKEAVAQLNDARAEIERLRAVIAEIDHVVEPDPSRVAMVRALVREVIDQDDALLRRLADPDD